MFFSPIKYTKPCLSPSGFWLRPAEWSDLPKAICSAPVVRWRFVLAEFRSSRRQVNNNLHNQLFMSVLIPFPLVDCTMTIRLCDFSLKKGQSERKFLELLTRQVSFILMLCQFSFQWIFVSRCSHLYFDLCQRIRIAAVYSWSSQEEINRIQIRAARSPVCYLFRSIFPQNALN